MLVEQCWHATPGGTASSIVDLVRAFADRRDVSAFGIAAQHSSLPAPSFRVPVDVRHLPFRRQVLYQAWSRSSRPSLDRYIADLDLDLVHATGGTIPPTSKPLVVTQHDLAWAHFPEMFTAHGVRFFKRTLANTIDRADLVLCPSQTTATDLAAKGIDPKIIRVVPWGVDLSAVPAVEIDRVRQRFELPERYVLFVGTQEPRKNLGRLIPAFVRAAPSDVALAIVGPQGWNENIDRLLSPLGDRAQRLGFVSRSDLLALYSGATAFAYPSIFEGFGLPVLEAMAQGAPVLTSAGTSTEELVGDAGVLVDPLDVGSIANGLGDLLAGGPDVAELSGLGKARAREFTWQRTADLTLDAYREVA